MSFVLNAFQRLLRSPVRYTCYGVFRSLYNDTMCSSSFVTSSRRYLSTRERAVVPSSYSEADLEVVDSIRLLIDKRIAPVVRQDGGDVSFISYDPETGFVYVRLSGACVGCAQSDITLKHMIQGTLCHYLDEVTGVMNCDEEGFVISSTDEDTDY